MMRSGARSVTAFSAASPDADDLRLGLAAALEGVLDEAGDVLFVFDDEYAVFGHGARSAYRPDVSRRMSKLLNVG